MTRPPSKADLQATVGRLAAENAALRDLLAAVRETAAAGDAISVDGDVWKAGGFAAQRIAIWLGGSAVYGDVAQWDMSRVESQARLFREHIGSITSLASPAAAPEGLEDAAAQDDEPTGMPERCDRTDDTGQRCMEDAGHAPTSACGGFYSTASPAGAS